MTLIRIVKQRLALVGAAVAALLGGGAAAAALLEQWSWAAVLLALSVVFLAALGLGIFMRLGDLLRLEQREAAWTRRIDERRRRFEQGEERWRRLQQGEERWRRSVLERIPHHIDDAVQRSMRLLGDRSDLQADLLEQTLLASVKVIRDDINRPGQLRALEQVLLTEIDALQQIHQRFSINGPVPLLGGWALSPTGLLQALDLAMTGRAQTVVECGSGASTIYLAWLLREQPGARLISLEHEVDFAAATRERLRELELGDVAEVRFAPLEPATVDGWSGDWYALDAVRDLDDIDLLLVDGPPRASGERARYPALPVFESRMSSTGIIILDDVNRAEEKAVLNSWLESGRWRSVRSSTSRQAVLQRQDIA